MQLQEAQELKAGVALAAKEVEEEKRQAKIEKNAAAVERAENARLKAELKRDKENQDALVEKRAKQKAEWKFVEIKAVLFIFIGLSFVPPILTGVLSERVRSDFVAFWVGLWGIVKLVAEKAFWAAKWAAEQADKIENETIAGILHWVLLILILVLVAGAVIGAGFVVFKLIWRAKKKGVFDWRFFVAVAMLVTVLIYLAERMPFNIFLSILIGVAAIFLFRLWRKTRRYY